MTRRRATLYGLLAVFAMLVSTAVAWSCALWSPMPGTRSLPEAEAAAILSDGLGTTTFLSRPGGLEHSGLGMSLTLAGDAKIAVPPREDGAQRIRNLGRNSSFAIMPGNPDNKWIQVVHAGWPLPCLQGSKKSIGRTIEWAGVMEPPKVLDNMGVKPRRLLPLYPRWTGLVVNTLFYGAVFWMAIPGPRVIRRHLRRRRSQCPECGYDIRHHEHATCPECGAA